MSGAICLHCSYTLAFFFCFCFCFWFLFLVLFLFLKNSQLNSTTMQNQGCQLQFSCHRYNALEMPPWRQFPLSLSLFLWQYHPIIISQLNLDFQLRSHTHMVHGRSESRIPSPHYPTRASSMGLVLMQGQERNKNKKHQKRKTGRGGEQTQIVGIKYSWSGEITALSVGSVWLGTLMRHRKNRSFYFFSFGVCERINIYVYTKVLQGIECRVGRSLRMRLLNKNIYM